MDDIHWYALYTKSRHELKVERQLSDKGIESYVPCRKVLRQWSDRKKWIEEPLFRSYVFIHVDPNDRYRALQTYGAVRIIAFGDQPAIVRDEEIQDIKRILREIPFVESCPPVSVGDYVEIIRGPLKSLKGRLVEIKGDYRLVISIESIHQAMRFNVDWSDIKVLKKGIKNERQVFQRSIHA